MINDEVINQIYKTYKHPPKKMDELKLDYFLEKLNVNHNIKVDDIEIINEDLEEFNPFRRFLIRSLYGILEFDKVIAFVFSGHILFFNKKNKDMRVHIKQARKRSLWDRILGR